VIRRTPLSIFTVSLVLVYWCGSVILSPFPYWVAKVLPVAAESVIDDPGMMCGNMDMDGGDGEVCCECGMGSGCTMPCCAGKKKAERGFISHTRMNHHDKNGECDLPTTDSIADSGVGCGCMMRVPPVDLPVEYIPVYGKHYYYPVQYLAAMAMINGMGGSVAGQDDYLSSLCEIRVPSPPPKYFL